MAQPTTNERLLTHIYGDGCGHDDCDLCRARAELKRQDAARDAGEPTLQYQPFAGLGDLLSK